MRRRDSRAAIPGPGWVTALGLAGAVAVAMVAAPATQPAPVANESPARPAASAPPSTASRQDDAPVPGARSPRNASYQIDARLDHATRTITAAAVVRWRNIGRAATDSLRLHLYWNAWRNSASTWLREEGLPAGGGGPRAADGDWGYVDVTALSLATDDGRAGADLLPAFRFVQPDDGNPADRTLAAVDLPRAVAPGETVLLRVEWRARVPRTFARTGTIGDFYFVAHWFPKLAVFEDGAWTAHQFHANTEFFADYGSYDVRLTVPAGWVVGATGAERARADNPDGTTTHHYQADDVHDFAWTTSPDFLDERQRFEHPGLPPVEMRLLLQPEHRGQADRHFAATAAALRYYGEWYGPYPYPSITIVDPAYQSGAGGMEYPTFFTAGTRWLAPRGSNVPEAVTIHEAGHQFWYGMVGNDEFADAWIDEGLNTFSEERVQEAAFQPNYLVERYFKGFIPWQFRDLALQRATEGNGLHFYRLTAERDIPSTPTFRYWPGSHAQISYFKTALWLHTLERHLGWDTLRRALATFFARWQYRHPRPDDFFAIVNEVSGRDLTWFFDQVYRSADVFDYGVERLDSRRESIRGFDDGRPAPAVGETRNDETYRTTVVVRRYGEAFFPVDVVTTFADGEQIRERWDGRERWRAWVYERPARAVRADVDPDRVLLLDVAPTNNSRVLAPETAAAADKWSLTWMIWLQDLLVTWAFFV